MRPAVACEGVRPGGHNTNNTIDWVQLYTGSWPPRPEATGGPTGPMERRGPKGLVKHTYLRLFHVLFPTSVRSLALGKARQAERLMGCPNATCFPMSEVSCRSVY